MDEQLISDSWQNVLQTSLEKICAAAPEQNNVKEDKMIEVCRLHHKLIAKVRYSRRLSGMLIERKRRAERAESNLAFDAALAVKRNGITMSRDAMFQGSVENNRTLVTKIMTDKAMIAGQQNSNHEKSKRNDDLQCPAPEQTATLIDLLREAQGSAEL
ncbi:MAG: hypothetical protein M1818_002046 [Claussenomyces sp. TS43310]|nr:MAG: hypothetical protein M1818_002046 [Claussenomyces sp. TS43310]